MSVLDRVFVTTILSIIVLLISGFIFKYLDEVGTKYDSIWKACQRVCFVLACVLAVVFIVLMYIAIWVAEA